MRIALTQSEGRLKGLPARLEQIGLEVWRIPLIRTQTLKGADLSPLYQCRCWLFGSVAAVQAVVELGGSLQHRWLGAVGPATRAALEQAGGRVELVAPEGNAASLARAFIARQENGWVGLPLGSRSLPTLAQHLSRGGYRVQSSVVYETISLPWPQGLGAPELIVLASPSALDSVSEAIGQRAHFLALGPTTALALFERGWSHTTVSYPNEEAILKAIEEIRGEPCPT